MNLLDHIDTTVVNGIIALYESLPSLDVQNFLPARIDQFTDGSELASNVRTLLSQIAFVVSGVLVVLLGIILSKKRALSEAKAASNSVVVSEPVVPAAPMGALRGRWSQIIEHLDSPRENDWKLAVVEADKLIDTALQQAGFPGDTFGDRLTNIQPGALVSLDGVWWAHRVRNRVAHELDYFLRYTEARQAMSYYQAVLEELRLI